MVGIYKFTNPVGEIYIGKSINIEYRYKQYKHADCAKQKKLFSSFFKYGFDNHEFEIIKECKEEDLNYYENYYIFEYLNKGKSLLNISIKKLFKDRKGRTFKYKKQEINKRVKNILNFNEEKYLNVLNKNKNIIESCSFNNEYVNKYFSSYKNYYLQMIDYYKDYISEENKENDLYYFDTNLNEIKSVFKTDNTNVPLTLFSILGLIKKHFTSKKNLPEFNKKSITRFSFVELNEENIKNLIKNCKQLDIVNFKFSNISIKYILHKLGRDKCKLVYPNLHDYIDTLNNESFDEELKIPDFKEIFNEIDKNGFALEVDFESILKEIKKSNNKFNEILKGYNLKRITANSYLKEKYGLTDLPERSYPKILIKNLEN